MKILSRQGKSEMTSQSTSARARWGKMEAREEEQGNKNNFSREAGAQTAQLLEK